MRTLVIGVGNRLRRDDGLGPAVLDAARAIGPKEAEYQEASGEGADLMDRWGPDDRVVLVDAVRAGADPGTVHRIDAAVDRVPSDFFAYSTHAFSVAEAVEMSRVLGRLPAALVLYGVEGGDFGHGEGLTSEVAAVVDDVARRVVAEL